MTELTNAELLALGSFITLVITGIVRAMVGVYRGYRHAHEDLRREIQKMDRRVAHLEAHCRIIPLEIPPENGIPPK